MRHWAEFGTGFSNVELVISSKTKKIGSLRTTYSCLDKLIPNDATLLPISYRSPRNSSSLASQAAVVPEIRARPTKPHEPEAEAVIPEVSGTNKIWNRFRTGGCQRTGAAVAGSFLFVAILEKNSENCPRSLEQPHQLRVAARCCQLTP